MSAIFISHSSEDNDVAREVARRLAGHNHHSVFLDFDPDQGIVAGQSWERTLYRKLRACRAVVALCTDHYLRSHWCFAEIALARMEGKPIIALQLDPLDAQAKMPAILTDRQLIDLRREPEDGFRRLWLGLGELDLAGAAGDWNPKMPPYLGLGAYHEEHAAVFFGREDESLAGVELLERGAPGLIMVLGASGSGKSSLVRAGMIPRLRGREDEWLIVEPFRPGRDPFAELTESLVEAWRRYAREQVESAGGREELRKRLRAAWDAAPPDTATADAAGFGPALPGEAHGDERLHRLIELLERLRADPPPLTEQLRNYLDWSLDDLHRLCRPDAPAGLPAAPVAQRDTALVAIARALRRAAGRRNARVLIVVDQFEELLGREPAADGVSRFLALLRASIEAEASPLMVLATMRSDFLGLFQRNAALQGIDFENLSLGPMRVEGMRRVIEMPARLAAIELEAGLADRLLADTGTPDALPLLSFTLWVLCRDRRDAGRLEIAEYERLGGLQGTISREADAVLESAQREHREDELRTALLQMARLSEDGSYARRPVERDHPDIRPVAAILDRLVERRVLVSRLEGDTPVVEVAHEALFRTWTPLRAWLDNARSDLLLKQQLERDATTWQDGGRNADQLWRGGRLLQARELIDRGNSDRSGPTTQFVRAGLRRRQLQRVVLATTTAVTIATLAGFLWYALDQAERAGREKARALDLARVSVAAEWLAKDPTQAALVLLEVEDPARTRFAPRRLSEALSRAFVIAEYPHAGPVHSVAVSSDGTRVLTTSGKRAIVWDARSGRMLRTLEHEETVNEGAFDPTGRLVATRAGEVGEHYFYDRAGSSAWVWDLASGTQRFVLRHDETLNAVAFSPDGKLLASASDDHSARLWDVATGALRFTLPHPDKVTSAVFSPDGRWLATVSAGAAQLWTVATGEPSGAPLAQDGSVRSVVFSPDSAVAVTVGYNGARAWEVETGKAGPAFDHEVARSAAFSADGRYLVTASATVARIWHAASGRPKLEEPIGHQNLVHASFNADSSLLITASGHPDRQGYGSLIADNALRFWDVERGSLRFVRALTHGREAMRIAFGPGNTVAAASSAERSARGRYETLREDPVARLWDIDVRDRRLLRTLAHAGPVQSASFSADGRRVLTIAGSKLRLWNPEADEAAIDLDHEKAVWAAAFTPDGGLVVSASSDGTARVWDAQSGAQRFAATHRDGVRAARLVAGDRLLATSSARTLRLWRVREGVAQIGEALFEAPFDSDELSGGEISADGSLAALRSGKTVTVWDVATRTPRFTLEHDGWVRTVAFIDDGRRLVTGADERLARVWDMQRGEPVFRLEHAFQLEHVAVSPDGRQILTLQAEDGVAHLWNAETGEEQFALPHGCGARDAWFAANGRLAATVSKDDRFRPDCDAKVVLWDAASGQQRASLAAVGAESVGFSQDGTLMFSQHNPRFTGDERSSRAASLVKMWDADTGEERFAEPFVTEQNMRSVDFSPDGRLLMTASGSEVRIWMLSGELLQSALAAATATCLKPDFRRQNLGESDDEARAKHEACERRHGRN